MLGIIGVGPRTGQYKTLTVLSGSMRPGIPVGAIVVDTPESGADLQVGQIVTYAIPVEDHRVITHRVVKIIAAGDHPVFQTRGDNNDAIDPWQAQVIGAEVWRVRGVVPGLGYAIHGLRQRTIHVIAVVVTPIVLALWCVLRIWRDDERVPDLEADLAAP